MNDSSTPHICHGLLCRPTFSIHLQISSGLAGNSEGYQGIARISKGQQRLARASTNQQGFTRVGSSFHVSGTRSGAVTARGGHSPRRGRGARGAVIMVMRSSRSTRRRAWRSAGATATAAASALGWPSSRRGRGACTATAWPSSHAMSGPGSAWIA